MFRASSSFPGHEKTQCLGGESGRVMAVMNSGFGAVSSLKFQTMEGY
jgi:hypothetical protein